MRTHSFQHNDKKVTLLFEIEESKPTRQLVLLDATGESIEHIMSVSDEVIEAEACLAASQLDAKYT
jgi:hypothetical protein